MKKFKKCMFKLLLFCIFQGNKKSEEDVDSQAAAGGLQMFCLPARCGTRAVSNFQRQNKSESKYVQTERSNTTHV